MMPSRAAVVICALALAGGIIAGFIPQRNKVDLTSQKELVAAVSRTDIPRLKILLNEHPNVNWSTSPASPSLLSLAVDGLFRVRFESRVPEKQRALRTKSYETISLLLEAGADPNRDHLHGLKALELCDPVLMEILIRHGARFNVESKPVTRFELHSFMFNDVRGLEKCLAMAKKAGYNINGRDSSGRTIMHQIARQGRWFDKRHPGVLELFLKNGLDLNAKDCLGLTPYDYAQFKEDREWLAGLGARPSP